MKIIYIFPIISTMIWGISIVGGKILSNKGFLPTEIVFLRFAIASLLFLPIIYLQSRRKVGYIPNRKSIKSIVGLALTGVVVNNLLFYTGLNKTNASVASLIVSFTPLTTIIFATFMLHEKLTFNKIISIILGVIGVSVILSFGNSGNLSGNLIILLAITIWSSSFSFSKIASDNGLSSIAITGWSQIIGTILLMPFVLNHHTIASYSNLDNVAISWFLYMGIISSLIAYILHFKAIAELGAGKVAPTINIIPFSGAFASWILLNDPLDISAIFGVILVIIGVIIVQAESTTSTKM